MAPTFAYMGSLAVENPASAWWVLHCTSWALSVAEYLVWDAYDTYRVWWISPRLRQALASFGEEMLRRVLGDDGYAD